MRTWPINSWKRRADTDTALKERESQLDGLSQAEAASRLNQYGPNEIAWEKRQSPLMRLLDNVKNPLVILLTALGVLSYLTGDLRARVVIFVMVLLGYVILTQVVKTWFIHKFGE